MSFFFLIYFCLAGMSSSKLVLELFFSPFLKAKLLPVSSPQSCLEFDVLHGSHIGEKGSACVITIIEN